MTKDRWHKLKRVFDRATTLFGEARHSYLAETCASDTALFVEVEGLLTAHEDSRGPLDELLVDEPLRTPLPARIGRYRVLRELGQGGMGTVVLARPDGHESASAVAIKMIHSDLESDFIVSRFRTEQALLGTLAHPNIAAFLDKGYTDEHRPYLVMEYVEGEPLDCFCDARHLDTRDRLRLMLLVLSAVQHAHEHLVLHLDLKPSNILVTREGQPKLLDFGLAESIDPTTRRCARHAFAPVRCFTPAFASPEQVGGGVVTPASDVYGLGVLMQHLMPARCRLPGFDAIVQQAMQLEPEDRHASVAALADELRTHLAGGLLSGAS